ncbi:P-loop containing nucleoside triphosphate hydrolase protein [Mollisia scopiformis]|uniref:p-loop containing nucleoside triphosphate hydrolase protein n=1 Tax=Mollisia scopiformis TaxID=149040 RepID=A0A194X9B5_MOLSC|nr:P-loop containing nucleoside triphosphate hydrolase protein [Mollisia scopiformis]KUJ16761.1 P-loop containing nucleoside triphosphate hydrolase protein [Mollisia scopiformis]
MGDNIQAADVSNIGVDPDVVTPVETVPGECCELKSLVLRSKKGEIEITEKNSRSKDDDPYIKFALVSRQSFDENHTHTGTTLEINSPQLLKALKDVITYYPGEALEFRAKFTIEAPYMMLVHYREDIRAYGEASGDTETKAHVKLLMNYLDDEAGPKGVETKEMINTGVITFPLLWMIYKPGDIICKRENGHSRLFQVRRHGYGESLNRGKYFDIGCSFVSYDGEHAGMSRERLRIWDRQEFFGLFSTTITFLSAFPVKFLEKSARLALEDKMAARGRRYLDINERCIKQYDGLFLYLKRPPWDYYNENAAYDGTFIPETMSGRVVIDPKTFNEEARAQKEQVESKADNNTEEVVDSKKPAALDFSEDLHSNDLDPRLCPSYIYGFSLEKKEWCKFFVDFMSPVEWKSNSLDSLIIPAPQKRLLEGLVTGHSFPDKARDEKNLKGKGLVVLLHGTPGSGKTLTAEVTAEHTQRALLNISTGELGSYQMRIEVELKRLLTYASTFQAIVLIDEADIFLEARKSGPADQLEQNAMVAVFLRQLEYFQGIIFLTSNRVSVFDQAIKSRIHLALQYASPGKCVRRTLWKKNLESVPREDLDLDLEKALDAVEGTEMNGREISNSITTAKTLAKSEGSKLKLEYLQTIVQVWSEFEESLSKMSVLEGSWVEK